VEVEFKLEFEGVEEAEDLDTGKLEIVVNLEFEVADLEKSGVTPDLGSGDLKLELELELRMEFEVGVNLAEEDSELDVTVVEFGFDLEVGLCD
jgi:hypothetical protein